MVIDSLRYYFLVILVSPSYICATRYAKGYGYHGIGFGLALLSGVVVDGFNLHALGVAGTGGLWLEPGAVMCASMTLTLA